MNVSILSIDAQHDGDGWNWNQWHKRGECPATWCDLPPRRFLQLLRAYVDIPPGRVAIEDDGFNVVVVDRHSRRPLYAVAYGEAQS